MNINKFIIDQDIEKNLEKFYISKGLVLPFIKLKKKRSVKEIKELFLNSLKRRDKIIKELGKIVNEDSYDYKDYVYKTKFIKDMIEKNSEQMIEKITSTLIELEIKLMEYDEKFLINKKLSEKETNELFSFV